MEYQNALSKLASAFGDQLTTVKSVRETHGQGEGHQKNCPPDAVLFAISTEDVATAVRICAAHKMPIIPYGAGSSLEGHVSAPKGGLSINLSKMNKVLALNALDMDVRIEPGITRKQLNQHLRDQGLFFPVDPGADATIGGMVATRASGTNAVKYGTMREQILSLKVVTPTGTIIETGTRAKKSAAGYDLTHLYCGSEGTLGIITEATLKLHPIPEKIAAGVCCFPDLESAINTVISVMQSGIGISRIELLDVLSIKAVNGYSKTNHKEAATLFLEFSGTNAAVAEQIETCKAIANDFNGADIEFAENQEAINKLWHARHQLYYATRALAPGKESITTDVCVPISQLADCMLETREDLTSSGLVATMLGHVGDGNFHTIILFDADAADEIAQVTELSEGMAKRAIAMGGTCTGEHGIGCGKQTYLEWERGNAVDIMRSVKTALDPDNIMNPGKIFRG